MRRPPLARPLRPRPRAGCPAGRVVGILFSLSLAAPLAAATVRVPADAATIAAALAAAQPGDTVLVDAGTYVEHDLTVPSAVVLRGATGDPRDVVLDGALAGRVLTLEGTSPGTVVEGLTLRRGLATGSGGAVAVLGGAPVIRDCRLEQNVAGGDGGALYVFEGAPLVERCAFTGNHSAGSTGGAVASRQSHPVLRHCTFTNNFAPGWGGAVYASGMAPRLEKCELRSNRSYYGGGVAANGADITLDRVVLRDNRAEHSGGGVLLAFGANLAATESEWSGNAAPEGKDVLVGGGCSALFRCCTLDPSTVAGGGPVTFDDTGCGVANAPLSWSALKQQYR